MVPFRWIIATRSSAYQLDLKPGFATREVLATIVELLEHARSHCGNEGTPKIIIRMA